MQANSDLIVEADGLTRRFGSFVAVDRVNLRVSRGSIYGFVGPSGSGKTTVIRMLCGLLKSSGGRAVVNGFDIDRDPERLRARLGYMSQKFSLYLDMTVRENLEFYGGVYGLPRKRLLARIDEMMSRLELRDRLDHLTAELPTGWKQRVALSAALLHEPPVLFLDEPTSGVDPTSGRLFWELLDDLSSAGISVFVTTHTMDEVERCDRVGIMYQGRLIADDSPAGLKRNFRGTLWQVEAEPLLSALAAARSLPFIDEAAMFGTSLHVTTPRADAPTIERGLEAADIAVRRMQAIAPNMEDVFVQLLALSQRNADVARHGEADAGLQR